MRTHKTMRQIGIGATAVAMLLATGIARAADEGAALAAARAASSAAIAVAERYEATSAFSGTEAQQNLPYIAQPFADLAARLFGLADTPIVAGPEAAMLITIDATGRTEAVLYDTSIDGIRIRDTTYRSANLSGTIRIDTAGGVIERSFIGAIPAPFDFMVTFGYDPYRDPNNAPFREALEADGGYAEAIARLLGAIYGREFLERAVGDRDPLIRRAAELALGD
ncbi:MAG: hypothetical protein WEC00_10350 [Dongiaceae bacterium]